VLSLRQPLRVVVDGTLQTPASAAIYDTAVAPTWLATAVSDAARHAPYLARGVRLLPCAADDGRVDLARLLQILAADGVNELMVEAGAGLGSALRSPPALVDEAVLYLAPYLAGDAARGCLHGRRWSRSTTRCRWRSATCAGRARYPLPSLFRRAE
jgi:diaminohydroxyphosphoribosylaminopyrimidine deaminase/5-amino-6-(5-phosphoribosylamino)uracil reductase